MKPILHQIHPILPVQNVVEALSYYIKQLGFIIAFADDSENPTYAGIRRGGIEIHLKWYDAKAWDTGFNTPSLRIVTEHIESLYEEYKHKEVFNKNTQLQEI